MHEERIRTRHKLVRAQVLARSLLAMIDSQHKVIFLKSRWLVLNLDMKSLQLVCMSAQYSTSVFLSRTTRQCHVDSTCRSRLRAFTHSKYARGWYPFDVMYRN